MRNAEYRCRMRIGLGLELGLESWLGVTVTVGVLFCSSIAQFHNFKHYALCRCSLQNGYGVTIMVGVSG